MAALDLSESKSDPLVYRLALSTNWKEVIFPPWARKASLKCATSLAVSFESDIAGATQPADGDAYSGTTHYLTQAADSWVSYELRDPGDRPRETQVTPARSIYIAASSGTPTVELMFTRAGV